MLKMKQKLMLDHIFANDSKSILPQSAQINSISIYLLP